jgi:thymidylate synthase
MKQYLQLLDDILTKGEAHNDRTGVGTLSLFGYQMRFDLREGFPLLTTKRLPFRWIAEELFWFLSGDTSETNLRARGVDIWEEWATPEQTAKFGRLPGDLGPVYGELWRNYPIGVRKDFSPTEIAQLIFHPTMDQIQWLLNEISSKPNSRRLIVTGWHPYYQQQVALPPCHTLWQVKIHPGKLMSLRLDARSIDSFLGLPFNIASYALLLSLLANVTGYEPKELVIQFGDVHLYKNHIEQAKLQLLREPRKLPTLEVCKWEESEDAWWTPMKRLLNFKYGHLILSGYDPYPAIKAEVAI